MAKRLNLKSRLLSGLRPSAAALAARGVTPERLTWIGVGLAAAVGGSLALAPGQPIVLLLLPAAVLTRLALTSIDALLVREHGLGGPAGARVNAVGDALADALLYLPLALHPGVAAWLVVAVVVLGLISEIAGLAASTTGEERRTEGPLKSSDRGLLFGLLALILAADPRAGDWLSWLLVPAVVLAAITIHKRLRLR